MTALANTRRRFVGALIATGFVAPGAFAKSIAAQSNPSFNLPECQRETKGNGPITRGERYRAIIYTDDELCAAIVPMKEDVDIPGFRYGRFGLKLSAKSTLGQAKLLTLLLPGAKEEDKEFIKQMHFTVSVNAQRLPGFTAPSARGDFVMFFDARKSLPRTYFQMTHDVEVGVYLPGKPRTAPPDHVLRFDKGRIAGATRIAQREMGALRQDFKAGLCRAAPERLCFLTTAAVDLLGLPDDCWELRQLRTMRDDWLTHQPGGADQIAEYYARAPAIAAMLETQPRRLARLYFRHILPSAIASRLGMNRLARWSYERMMMTVCDLG